MKGYATGNANRTGFGSHHVLAALAFVVPPLAVVSPKGMAVAFSLAAVAALIERWRSAALGEVWRGPVFTILAATVAWGAASALWAVDGGAALGRAGRLLPVFLAIPVLLAAARATRDYGHGHGREAIATPLMLGMAIAAVLLLEEFFTDGAVGRLLRGLPAESPDWQIFLLNGGTAVFLMLSWPLALILWRRRRLLLLVLLVIAVGAITWETGSRTARVALPVALMAFALTAWLGPRAAGILGGLVVAAFLAAPLFALTALAPDRIEANFPDLRGSALHRTIMWEFAARRIIEKPLAGWGLDSSRRIPGGDREVPNAAARGLDGATMLGLHPHNAALQAWLELGLPGAALLAALAWLTFRTPRRWRDPVAQAAAAACTATAITFGLSSWNLWQTWWMATLAIAAAIMIAAAPPDVPERR